MRQLTGFLSLVLLVACSPQQEQPELHQLSGSTMGTTYHISIVGDAVVPAEDIRQTLEAIENSMSTYRENSELMRLNRAPLHTWITVSRPLFEVLELSQQIAELSNGAFDISIAPLVDLWGFGPQFMTESGIPDDQSINELLNRVDYRYLSLNAETLSVMKSQDISLDLSAVAKGYGVDSVAALLAGQGINDFLVEIGGEIRSAGHNAQGELWRIAIERPDDDLNTTQRVVQLSGVGVASSGDYRNFFTINDTRYSHTIDPRDGWPVSHGLAAVTVIAQTSARADALATAFSVLGPDDSMRLATANDIAAYFLVRSEEDTYTEAWSQAFASYLSGNGTP